MATGERESPYGKFVLRNFPEKSMLSTNDAQYAALLAGYNARHAP